MTLEIVKAELRHAEAIGANLRTGDWLELLGMGYKTGAEAVSACMQDCPDSVTCLEDGVPIAAWGYKADPCLALNTAYLWCMTTPAVERHKRSILRLSRAFVDGLLLQYSVLESATSPVYPQAVRWVEWLGFKTVSNIVMNNTIFHIIVKKRES